VKLEEYSVEKANLKTQIDNLTSENINLRDTMNASKANYLQSEDLIAEHVRTKALLEQEVKSLKSDLEFLAKSNVSGVEERLLIARQEEEERVKTSMRRELEEMRAHQASAEMETEDTKRLHRIGEEQLAGARLKVSMLERELESAKADTHYMKEAIERLKGRNDEALSGAKARVAVLERDREELLNNHVTEMRGMRKQIQKLEQECDEFRRLVEDREGEISILNSTITSEEAVGEKEIERLRYEKAQLLASARKNATGFERKLREATAVAAGRREAEFIALSTAKSNAENRIAELLGEIGELKTTLDILKEGRDKGLESEFEAMGELRMEVEKLKSENEALRVENNQLTQRITANFEEMDRSTVILNERARIAEMRLKQVEDREKEGLLRIEKAKLREEVGLRGGEGEGALEELEDLRAMYEDLEVEHEDLLALLAQQQVEKDFLQQGLMTYGGDEAINNALQQAEEMCITRFQQYIQMEN